MIEYQKMALTKNDISEEMHGFGLTRKKTIKILDSLLEIIKKTLENGEEVLVSGFGKFCVKIKEKRIWVNPLTGGKMVIKKKIITFKCSNKLKRKLNNS